MSRRSFPFLSAILAVVGLAAPAVTSATTTTDELSSRLQMLAGSDLRSASSADQADAVSLLTRGPGSLLRDGGSLVVDVRVSGAVADRVEGVKEAGAEIVAVASDYGLIEASIPEGRLPALAAAPGVVSVTEVLTPMSGAVHQPSDADGGSGAINTCATGVVSEGDAQLGASAARTQFDVDGTGIKVGVLSDSFDLKPTGVKHANDVASGDLPGPGNPCGRTTPVQIVDDTATFIPPNEPADEGRAMAQIVHDIAPGADLAFATAATGEVAFAQNIQDLANAGSDVIVDDFIYFAEPYFQDGIIANAVSTVTSQGASYFTMAFNNNRIIGGNDSNSWEAPAYRSAGACPAFVGAGDCMDFDPGPGVDNTFNLTAVGAKRWRFGLQWAEPQNGVTTNLDLFIKDAASADPALKSINVNATTGKPFEFISFITDNTSPGNYQLAIRRTSGAGIPRLKWVNNDNGSGSIAALEYPVSAGGDTVGPTIYGHNGTAAAQTVGAVPFNNSAVMESYSSRGPVTHLFGPVNGVTPAPALPAPEVLSKPDVAATDGGINTFFGTGNRFFGTSAAAPHAAGVAALQLEAEPSLTGAELRDAQTSTADPVGAFGPLVAGAGLIDAPAALLAGDKTPPSLAISKKPGKKTKSKKAKFKFTFEAGATLQCKIDKKPFKSCSASATFKVKPGKHKFEVQATDLAGNVASVKYSWTYKKKKKKH